MKRILQVVFVWLVLAGAAFATPSAWYVPGWRRCGTPDPIAWEGFTNTFATVKCAFYDWDGNHSWWKSREIADRSYTNLVERIVALPESTRTNLTLVGHSLGGRMVARALAELGARGKPVKLGVVLAAAIPNNDPVLEKMGSGSQMPVICICNPADIVLKYTYRMSGEAVSALGASGPLHALPHVIEQTVPEKIISEAEVKAAWGKVERFKHVASHHAFFYILALRRTLGGKLPTNTTALVPQEKLNWSWKVIDAGVWWNVLEKKNGWKLERNKVTGFCRIINPTRHRVAWGREAEMRAAFKRALEHVTGVETVALADFTQPKHGWQPLMHATRGVTTAAGFSIDVFDEDPWLVSGPVTFPAIPPNAEYVKFTVTCAPTPCSKAWQLFFAMGRGGFCEERSVRLVPEGEPPYTRFSGDIPANRLSSGPARLRLDPPGTPPEKPLKFTVKALTAEFMSPLFRYNPPQPPPLVLNDVLHLAGSNWELAHSKTRFGAFRIVMNGKTIEGLPDEKIVYCDDAGVVRELDLSRKRCRSEYLVDAALPQPGSPLDSIQAELVMLDADGRTWQIKRLFQPGEGGRSLTISTKIVPSRPVSILHVPFLTLFIDRNSSGHKHQAMLAGVEYLDDEPSSNMKEIRTHSHDRTIPAEYRLTAPLAVFTDAHYWLGFSWDRFAWNADRPNAKFERPMGPLPYATVFDSPDRIFKSGGHLLAFWAPAVGVARRESKRAIFEATPFAPATHVVTLRSGKGGDVATALETLVPPHLLPKPNQIDRRAALELLAHGWLDSSVRDGTRVRHACAPNFKFTQATDAPYLMQYLASMLARTEPASTNLPPRLRDVAAAMLAEIKPQEIGRNTISHVRRPAPVLVGGDLTNYLNRCAAELVVNNRQFASGKSIYHPREGKRNLGETLGADHCNGYTAMQVEGVVAKATWCGNEAEIEKTLAIVDRMTALYHGTVPRGAQPWEMPLHTPDIMASAHLTRLYTLAYQLRPDPAYLEEARHWAYSGYSMVSFVPPPRAFPEGTDPVGVYSTCGVMGATNWAEPNWIGRPVQWCGLVYAAALWDLARIDDRPQSCWKEVAAGITASGVCQTHTADEPENVGLLPDSWNLLKQDRYFCPINPGTVEENLAAYLYLPFYSLTAAPLRKDDQKPVLIHAPGQVDVLTGTPEGRIDVFVDLWPEAPSRIVLTRLDRPKSVEFLAQKIPYAYLAERRALIVTLPARAAGTLRVAVK